MTETLAAGDRVRFAPGYERNHRAGSPSIAVGFGRVGIVVATGKVPNGPKAGVPYLDVDFPATRDRLEMRLKMVDRARFERAGTGAA